MTRPHDQIAIPIRDSSDPGEARRRAVSLARQQGYSDSDQGRVAIVVTEVATNIVKHAGSGEVILGTVEDGLPYRGIEVLGLDRGSGMASVAQCLQNGYSTAGSPGTGLGAVDRLSSEFDLHSQVGVGTAVVARIWPSPWRAAPRASPLEVGAICLPIRGEVECGDAWCVVQRDTRAVVTVVDGLGHGPAAAQAAREAIRIFRRHAFESADVVLEMAHRALRSTRGAAMAIADLDLDERAIAFAGIGNISAVIVRGGGSTRSLVSQNGTLGAQVRRIQLFTEPWPEGADLIMYSDGLISHWDLQKYSGLLARSPAVVAAVLYRDYSRGRDDVTVAVARQREVL